MESHSSDLHPFLRTNIFSQFFHSWITDLFARSHKQGTLHLEDLYNVLPDFEATPLTERLEKNWFDEVNQSSRKPSLIRATFRTVGWKPFLISFVLILSETGSIAQPLLVTFLMDFFGPCSTMPVWQAWCLACAIVFSATCSSICEHWGSHLLMICGHRLRTAYMGLIFRKVLRLSSHATNSLSSGEIVNLISNDAGQIHMTLWFINSLWIVPIKVILITLLFWYFIKYIAFVAIGYTILLLIIQSLLGRLLIHFRSKILQVTDKRIKIMSEIIKSMRVIKMYCWESAFERKIRQVRKNEIIQTGYRSMINCIQVFLSHTYIGMTFLMIYGTMWAFNIPFDIRFFAIASCILGYMRFFVVEVFGMGIRETGHYLAAKRRIEAFLLLDEYKRNHAKTTQDVRQTEEAHVLCDIKQARWEKDGPFSLRNILISAHPGDLICVIGSVGSGKSSLLQTLCGEIPYCDGNIQLRGSYCYVPQESWIFSSTIKSNILFGKEYDEKLFKRVVHATALDNDFGQLSYGPNTLVGDQGVMLSGGQKARVNMARALYRDADIYLLDDPLSAVDVKVAKHLFEKSIKTYLKEKLCILVTHQIQFLQDATSIIVLDNGEMVQIGTYAELMTSSPVFVRLLANIYQQQQHSVDLQKQQSIISSVQSKDEIEEEVESTPVNVEIKQEGTVNWHVYVAYLRAGIGIVLGLFLIIVLFSSHQAAALLTNWWLARWNEEESHRHRVLNNCTSINIHKNNTIRDMNDVQWNLHRNNQFYGFCGIVLFLIVMTFFRTATGIFVCLNAGRVLHNKMFKRLIRCPISFFDSNAAGRILNRFTKDVANMDDDLPVNILDLIGCVFNVLGIVILVGWLNPWSFIPSGLAVICMLYVRHQYASCFRDLARLEGITRSPLYSHLTSTIHGLKVVRSYQAESMCSAEFLSHADDITRVYHSYLTANRWAGMRLDWISLGFIAAVTLLAMIGQITGYHRFSSADIILTFSYSLTLVDLFQWTIRQSVAIETQMTSVERVLEYCSLDQEPPGKMSNNRHSFANWPTHGEIIFENVSMCHSTDEDAPLALRHISLAIEAGEKIGIVGRTGAGKSSFIQTLFRMGTLIDGKVLIDDIDISTVGLDDIRPKISVIPQDPILFTGTLRNNLDPFDDYSDTQIWHSLEEVQLKTFVAENMPDGLQSIVNEGGSNLSVGQKQLICLARAILKKTKILVIDEATANVDNVTDELIQKAIRKSFQECTVLTVAHRLRTVIDSDRILILGNGEVVEFDTPDALLANSGSHFTSLIEQTGKAESEHLRKLANNTTTTARLRRKPFEQEKNLPTDSIETDPLLDKT